jgi:acetyl esterase/lipase
MDTQEQQQQQQQQQPPSMAQTGRSRSKGFLNRGNTLPFFSSAAQADPQSQGKRSNSLMSTLSNLSITRTLSRSAASTSTTTTDQLPTSPTTTTTTTTTEPASSTSKNYHPSWNTTAALTISALRVTLQTNKDNLFRARSMTSIGAAPAPIQVRINRVNVPRRKDVAPEGLLPDLSNDKPLKAEWVEYPLSSSSSLTSSSSTTTPPSNSILPPPHPTHRLASPNERVVLYLHGGAYFICSPKTHRMITWRISKYAQAKVLALDYRLAPESVFPAQLHDALSAFMYLVDPPKDVPNLVKYQPHQVVVMGDSAGGGLTISTGLWLRDNGARILKSIGGNGARMMPGGLGCMSPWLDLTHSLPSFQLNGCYDYLPERSIDPKYINEDRLHYYVLDNAQLTHPLVSPFFAADDPENPLCPTLIQAGSAERLRDEILLFSSEKFQHSPVQLEIYEGMVHVFQMLTAILPISKHALKRMGEFALRVTDPALFNSNNNHHTETSESEETIIKTESERSPPSSSSTVCTDTTTDTTYPFHATHPRKMTFITHIPSATYFPETLFNAEDVQKTVQEAEDILRRASTDKDFEMRPNNIYRSGTTVSSSASSYSSSSTPPPPSISGESTAAASISPSDASTAVNVTTGGKVTDNKQGLVSEPEEELEFLTDSAEINRYYDINSRIHKDAKDEEEEEAGVDKELGVLHDTEALVNHLAAERAVRA